MENYQGPERRIADELEPQDVTEILNQHQNFSDLARALNTVGGRIEDKIIIEGNQYKLRDIVEFVETTGEYMRNNPDKFEDVKAGLDSYWSWTVMEGARAIQQSPTFRKALEECGENFANGQAESKAA